MLCSPPTSLPYNSQQRPFFLHPSELQLWFFTSNGDSFLGLWSYLHLSVFLLFAKSDTSCAAKDPIFKRKISSIASPWGTQKVIHHWEIEKREARPFTWREWNPQPRKFLLCSSTTVNHCGTTAHKSFFPNEFHGLAVQLNGLSLSLVSQSGIQKLILQCWKNEQ